jgi:hypothetical protein
VADRETGISVPAGATRHPAGVTGADAAAVDVHTASAQPAAAAARIRDRHTALNA